MSDILKRHHAIRPLRLPVLGGFHAELASDRVVVDAEAFRRLAGAGTPAALEDAAALYLRAGPRAS